jgi:hypothetical protein
MSNNKRVHPPSTTHASEQSARPYDPSLQQHDSDYSDSSQLVVSPELVSSTSTLMSPSPTDLKRADRKRSRFSNDSTMQQQQQQQHSAGPSSVTTDGGSDSSAAVMQSIRHMSIHDHPAAAAMSSSSSTVLSISSSSSSSSSSSAHASSSSSSSADWLRLDDELMFRVLELLDTHSMLRTSWVCARYSRVFAAYKARRSHLSFTRWRHLPLLLVHQPVAFAAQFGGMKRLDFSHMNCSQHTIGAHIYLTDHVLSWMLTSLPQLESLDAAR